MHEYSEINLFVFEISIRSKTLIEINSRLK